MPFVTNKPYDLATADHDYPNWSGPPARTVLICTHPRSGSTLLGEALYFAGDLGCPIEYFHAGFRPKLEAEWAVSAPSGYLGEVWRRRTAPSGVLSVKLMWSDVQQLAAEYDPVGLAPIEADSPEAVPPETYRRLACLLREFFPAPTCVHLFRRDRVRQAVSGAIATQTGQWRSIRGAEMARVRAPEYDAQLFGKLIAYSDFCHGHWHNLLAQMNAPCLSLGYEELVRDYAGNVGRLLAALGSSGSPPAARMQRQADADSEAFVARYLRECGVPAAS